MMGKGKIVVDNDQEAIRMMMRIGVKSSSLIKYEWTGVV